MNVAKVSSNAKKTAREPGFKGSRTWRPTCPNSHEFNFRKKWGGHWGSACKTSRSKRRCLNRGQAKKPHQMPAGKQNVDANPAITELKVRERQEVGKGATKLSAFARKKKPKIIQEKERELREKRNPSHCATPSDKKRGQIQKNWAMDLTWGDAVNEEKEPTELW